MNAGKVRPSVISPGRWYETFPAAVLSGTMEAGARVLVHRFVAIPPKIIQPAMREHVVAMHLGGPKRVMRWHGGRQTVQDVKLGSLTLMPAFQANRWLTRGPIDFAHLTLSPGYVNRVIVEEFDHDPGSFELYDRVGIVDPMLEHLFQALLHEMEAGTGFRLYVEGLLTVFAVTLMKGYSTLEAHQRTTLVGPSVHSIRKGGLAGWQLSRVVDRMNDALAAEFDLGGLAQLTGLSRAQFFRAFKQSTGFSPGRFLSDLRIKQAQALLASSKLPVAAVAAAVGFASPRHFATVFKRRMGVSPRLYKKSRE